MKNCKVCKIDKDESEFYKTSYKDKVYSLNECKKCLLKRTAKNYKKDNLRQKEIRKNNTAKRRLSRRQIVLDYLVNNPCVDCGEADPIVLEFDHVIGKKLFDISDGLMKPIKIFEDEIKKCEVVCSNCHRKRTAKRAGNWYKNIN